MGGGGAPERDLYQEIYGELTAKRDLMPSIFAAESQFRPGYSALEMNNLQDILFGSAGGTQTMEYTTPAAPSLLAAGGRVGRGANLGPAGQRERRTLAATLPGTTQTSTFTTPASPGLVGLVNSIDPQNAALWDQLTQSATEELGYGAALDPELERLYAQTTRAGQAARGLGYGPADVLQEGRTLTELGQNLRTQRRAFATNTAQLNQSRLNDLLNRALGISSGSGPRLFGSTVNANDVFSSNQNAAAANSAADAQMTGTAVAAAAAILPTLFAAI